MKLRRLLLLAGLIGISILIMAHLGDLSKFLDALQDLQWYVIPLVIIVQLASYYYNARYYQTFFAISKYHIGLRRLFETSLAINFANQVLPSGGVAGTTYLSEAVKPEVPAGTAALAQLGRYVFTFLSYFIVLAVGFLLLFLARNSDLNKPSVKLVIILMLAVLVLGIILLMVFRERRRLEVVLQRGVRAINWFGRVVLRRSKPLIGNERIASFLDEFYIGYHLVMDHKGRWPKLLALSLDYNVTEVLTIYVVFVGLGIWINPGVVITAYTLAINASLAGFLTGGIGVYELGMIGTFTALGVPFATAFTVVLVYRALSMILFLPPGFYFYRRRLLGKAPKEATT
jgi:uncharacterized protein (TIRG00374 family)